MTPTQNDRWSPTRIGVLLLAIGGLSFTACTKATDESVDGPPDVTPVKQATAKFKGEARFLNTDAGNQGCAADATYKQEELREPVKIQAGEDGVLATQLVVGIRNRCVPVWNTKGGTVITPATDDAAATYTGAWEMKTLALRTYGHPRQLNEEITPEDTVDPATPNIVWSAPGPTFVLNKAAEVGGEGTHFKMKLFNAMPWQDNPHDCDVMLKCNKDEGLDAEGNCITTTGGGGVDPFIQSESYTNSDGEEVTVIPPNCFHGNNSTNFHFHGFHVSPQPGQDDVLLELLPFPPVPEIGEEAKKRNMHGDRGDTQVGFVDIDVDPLRYTQAPGTHWYHAHKHGSTALQVLNGLVGTFEIRGAFDEEIEGWFASEGGGELRDRLMVVQQLQERQPGLGGEDQNGSVLVNGMANPTVTMAPGEIQRWRFVGATMQASAQLQVGFPTVEGAESPQVKQIAMDGVQFDPKNYTRQPILSPPKVYVDASAKKAESSFDELTSFALSPGNRIDVLVKAPDTPGTYCMMQKRTANLKGSAGEAISAAQAQQAKADGTCPTSDSTSAPLFTLVVSKAPAKAMSFPTEEQFPDMPDYLGAIQENEGGGFLPRTVNYEMQKQTDLKETQFWINQQKFNGDCVNETLTLGVAEEWTLQNNSGVGHPFHIHINPFQLTHEHGWDTGGEYNVNYAAPYVWRDTLAIPTANVPSGQFNLDPEGPTDDWGDATLVYVAEEFTGEYVNHCHILGHEDRGMMHATQAVCPNGQFGKPNLVTNVEEQCDERGFCQTECVEGNYKPASPACAVPAAQQSDWVHDVTNTAVPATVKPAKKTAPE